VAGKPAVEKVAAYITHRGRLLVFRHVAFPAAGIQVPGGTIQPGETPEAAVLREAREETGLTSLTLDAYLGAREYDLTDLGLPVIQRRHYFHLVASGSPPERWRHFEMSPSDGSVEPIEFELYWVHIPEGIPELTGWLGDMLPVLSRSR
jgi:8-oxo-dGTP pyrophosphatase MutT (NUDIX family)